MSLQHKEFDTKRHFNSLTGIRGIAACWVVIFHIKGYLTIYNDSWWWSFLEKGYLAVDLFFILSGFVIYLNYGKCFSFQSSKLFLIKRLARIYPLHVVVLLCYLSLPTAIYFFSAQKIVSDNFSVETFIANVFLYQSWGMYENLSWNIPAWSISAEWFSYLIFCISAVFYNKMQNKILLPLFLIVLICIVIAITCHVRGYVSIGDDIPNFAVYRCSLQFILGNLLALVLLRNGMKIPRFLQLLFIVAATLLVFQTLYNGVLDYFVMPITFCFFITFLTTSNGWLVRLLELKLFVYLGDISYSIYMWHYFIRDWFKVFFVHDAAVVDFRYLIAYFVLVIFLSDLSYRYIEVTLKKQFLRCF